MNKKDFMKKLSEIPEVEPDAIDQKMILKMENDPETKEKWGTLKDYNKKVANGKIALRLPIDLHEKAIACAKEQGVSLNTYLLYLIATGVAEDGHFEEVPEKKKTEKSHRKNRNELAYA